MGGGGCAPTQGFHPCTPNPNQFFDCTTLKPLAIAVLVLKLCQP
jgi:hypothetical protein